MSSICFGSVLKVKFGKNVHPYHYLELIYALICIFYSVFTDLLMMSLSLLSFEYGTRFIKTTPVIYLSMGDYINIMLCYVMLCYFMLS